MGIPRRYGLAPLDVGDAVSRAVNHKLLFDSLDKHGGFLALSFGDVDTDKDGLINAEQFDQLLAEVSAIPRRYGLAPLDVGDAVSRAVNHKILFDSLDKT